MAMQLFIDTNIYLSFYQHSKDDVRDLDELLEEVFYDRIILHIPEQVDDELERNREARLSAAAKEFQKNFFSSEIPRHMQGLAMAQSYIDATNDAKRARDHLIAESLAKARSFQLDVDKKLELIFDAAKYHDHDPAILAKGRLRAELGNPPGKPGSVGDQYNWEMLLSRLPDEDLYVVTKDGDFVSALDGKDERGMPYPNPFLKREWAHLKGKSNLYTFDSIKALLKHYKKALANQAAQQAPAEQPAEEPAQPAKQEANQPVQVEVDRPAEQARNDYVQPELVPLSPEQQAAKTAAIAALQASGSFATTHSLIPTLNEFRDSFTADEVTKLFRAAIDNNQVGWIISDNDVNEFYMFLFSRYVSQVDPDLMDEAIDLLGLSPDPKDGGPLDDEWELL